MLQLFKRAVVENVEKSRCLLESFYSGMALIAMLKELQSKFKFPVQTQRSAL